MPLIFDTVYGNIDVNPNDFKFIDNMWVKRLKRINQLGLLEHVFPSASHSRFEHSLGVYHIAGKYIDILENKSKKKLFTKKEKQCVMLAGLFHDLGHGPFSHVFDNILSKINSKNTINDHETRSKHIVEKIFKEVQPKNFNGYDIDLIKNLINPSSELFTNTMEGYYNVEKPYLFEIINNKINNIDVDKFDYLQRDSKHLGLESNFDPGRIMNKSYVCHERKRLIYDISLQNNIFDLFYTRYKFHKDIYNHKTVKMCELMLLDSLSNLSKEYLNIEDYCKIIDGTLSDQFLELDDSIYNKILFSKEEKLNTSKHLLKRIEERDLYKCLDIEEISLDDAISSKSLYQEKYDIDCNQIKLSFNLCNGYNDPLNNVLFQNKNNGEISHGKIYNRLIPSRYQEDINIIYKTS